MPAIDASPPTNVGAEEVANRAEKKARKAISKLGLERVPEIKRVVLKKNKQLLFIVAKPDVYKAPTSETYVVVGEAKVEDLSQSGNQFDVGTLHELETATALPAATAAGGEAEAEEGEVDATGLVEEDISLVMEQGPTSRAKAVAALLKTKGDVVEAIMALSG